MGLGPPTSFDIKTPDVDSYYASFSQRQRPALGQVVEVDTTNPRPVVVQLLEPVQPFAKLHLAQFQPVRNAEDDSAKVSRITLHQILFKVKHLSRRGFLPATDRRRLQKCLSR